MARRLSWLILLTLTISALPGAPRAGTPVIDCAGSPAEAVLMLPPPLNKWGQITCTPYGHVLAGTGNWTWVWPDGSGTVFIPSQLVMSNPELLGNRSYFTHIEVTRVRGAEFDQAYATFREGLAVPKEVPPDVYRADLTSVSGKTMKVYFFDYDTFAWGMSCPDNNCVQDSRFIMLDRTREPLPRQPPI
jgi:hypothetical protein